MLEVKFEEEVGKYEDRTVMIVHHKGEEISRHYDGGEPEDNTFYRDWNWVPGAIENAYKLGVQDGKDEG